MKSKKLVLKDLRLRSFITDTIAADQIRAGLKCPLYTHDDLICDLNTLDPQGVTCNSTGNTDNPTGSPSDI